MTITKKSIIFHAFLKYEFSCKIKPNAIILHEASTQNMLRKNGSVASNFTASVVRSPSGKCCSKAITRQFKMIVTKIVYSNGGHSMMKRVSRRNGWSSVNKNNDVGPDEMGTRIVGGTTSTLTFWREVVVVCVDTFAPAPDAGASCAASLFTVILHVNKKSFLFLNLILWIFKSSLIESIQTLHFQLQFCALNKNEDGSFYWKIVKNIIGLI